MMQYKKIIALFSLVMIFAIPLLAHGATISKFEPLSADFEIDVTDILESIFNILWPIVVTVVIIAFIFAGFKFLTAQGDPTKIAAARIAVVWGVVGVAVIVLSASAVLIVTDLINPPSPPPAPPAPGTGACENNPAPFCNEGKTQQECEDPNGPGGTYKGDGSTCPGSGTPKGACCGPAAGICNEQVESADCTNNTGTYQGDGTTCTSNPCP